MEEPCELTHPNIHRLFHEYTDEMGIYGKARKEYFIAAYRSFHLRNNVFMAGNGSKNGSNKVGEKDTTDCSLLGKTLEKVYPGFDSERALETSKLLHRAGRSLTATALDLFDANVGLIPVEDKDMFTEFR